MIMQLVAEGTPKPSPIVEIVDATLFHIKEMTDTMRPSDLKEALAIGMTPGRLMMRSFRNSMHPKSALIDGKLAAVWGCAGTLIGNTGAPWLVTSNNVYLISPLKFARIYQQQVKEMLATYPVLVNWVDSTYTEAVKMLEIIGFTLESPCLLGRGLFRRFYMERAA